METDLIPGFYIVVLLMMTFLILGAPLLVLLLIHREVKTTGRQTRYWREKFKGDADTTTLLRAVNPETPAETLLRPTVAGADSHPRELLRAGLPEPSERG
jgi:hypothetical protein